MSIYKLNYYDITIAGHTYGVDAEIYLETSEYGFVDIDYINIYRVNDDGNFVDFSEIEGRIIEIITDDFNGPDNTLYEDCEKFHRDWED